MLDHHVSNEIDNIVRADTTGDVDRGGFFGELVDQREDLERPTIGGHIHHQAPTPEAILVERSQPYTRSVGELEPDALGVLVSYLQSLLLPPAPLRA